MRIGKIIPAVAILLVVFTASCKKDDNNSNSSMLTVSADPISNETSVARNKVIAVTFSEAMDPSTVNTMSFTLKQGSTEVGGFVAYAGLIATFTPSGTLLAATEYTATITTEATSLTGNTLVSNKVWSFTTAGSTTGIASVNLGGAGNYVILAKTAITNISTSAVTGNLGLSPAATSYITGLALTNATGYATSAQVTGHIYAADMADPTPITLTTAVNNMITAYNDAAGRSLPDFVELGTGIIGGYTLAPGLYKWTSTVTIPTDVTISGSATDVWIFQIAGDLTMSSAVNITLSGGAQAKNIFWQVAGQATIGTTAHFEGIILSMTGITFQTGASMNGRALAQTAVVLDGNAITEPVQ
ncbi:MAG TPA: ice-binding family protein [Williamwhitmania sp.]|nr:ice-binding family protein [Williamwhitmania sp.]